MTTDTRTALGFLTGIIFSLLLILGPDLASQPPVPGPISVRPITEAQIKEDVKREQRAKLYKNANRVVVQTLTRNGCSVRYANLIGHTAVDYGLSPRLLAAVVFIESGCRPTAVSGRDSIGLMQVNPRVWGHRKELKDPTQNLKIGASILASYIRQFGIVEGLHHYNGYSEVHEHVYVNKVLTAAGMRAKVVKG